MTLPDDPGVPSATSEGMMNMGREWYRSTNRTTACATNEVIWEASHRLRDVGVSSANTQPLTRWRFRLNLQIRLSVCQDVSIVPVMRVY